MSGRICIEKLRELADGNFDPEGISSWAIEEGIRLDEEGVVLSEAEQEALENLQLSGTKNEKGSYLYTQEDFKRWLHDLEMSN